MSRSQRISLFLTSLLILSVIGYFVYDDFPPTGTQAVVVYSALIMLSLATFLLEHFFTAPTDVLSSSLSILLLISPIHNELSKLGVWYLILWAYCAVMIVIALVALLLLSNNLPSSSWQNKTSEWLKRVSSTFGNGRWLFFSIFFLTLVFYVKSESPQFLMLAGYSALLLVVNPRKAMISLRPDQKRADDIGEIIGVQSRNIFLAKLYQKRSRVKRFEPVMFRYSMDEEAHVLGGLILDTYLLDEQQWVRILRHDEIVTAVSEVDQSKVDRVNVVYKLKNEIVVPLLDRLIGTVAEDSKIEKIVFEYAEKVIASEGMLAEVNVGEARVFYQIVQGITQIEQLEKKNETGLIRGEAIQLGNWNSERLVFEKFGWVPQINAPVLKTQNSEPCIVPEGEILLGKIPDTEFPVLLNIKDAITHHIAFLGVTGSGKSVLARSFIRTLATNDIKVIVVDFTNESKTRLQNLPPADIVSAANKATIETAIDGIEAELVKWPKDQSKPTIERNETTLLSTFEQSITDFLNSRSSVGIFDLPEFTATYGLLNYIKWFFKAVFNIARDHQNHGKTVCIVLEEAHTIIPEWNFIGVEDKRANAIVNSIGQIALLGRKYNIGFAVIAQRTANVSKTVLTQCNSIVAFQQFDKTGLDFLSNYMGTEMAQALPSLRPRHAVAVGKAFKSGVPMIFRVPEIVE